MDTPLTDEQQQLLSAWLDGEVTDAEKQTVEQLLQREDAKQYLESLRATAALVTKHGPARAPVGLSGRVLSELEKDFKPKAMGPGSEPFESIPTISWRTPLYAVAAAVIVSLGIMFGPSLFGPGDASPTGVARGVLDNIAPAAAYPDAPAGDAMDEESVEDSLESLQEDARSTGGDSEKLRKDLREVEKSSDELRRELRDGKSAEEKESWGGGSGAGEKTRRTERANDAESPKQDPTESENEKAETKPAQPNSAARPGEGKSRQAGEPGADKDKPADNSGEDDANDAARLKSGREPAAGNVPTPERSKKEDNAKHDSGDAGGKSGANSDGQDRGIGGGKPEPEPKKKGGSTPPAPAPPEATPAEEGGDDGTENFGKQKDVQAREVEISDAHSLTAQTDVLWVSSLYGDASVSDEAEEGLESITVEVDADKVSELLSALRRLAKDQGYGEVGGADAGEATAEALDDKRSERHINGYLPLDEQDAEEAPALSNPAEPTTPETQESARVKLVIRLK